MRILKNDAEIWSNLIVAKTKVASIKLTTIPKLELCGAVLVTKLMANTSKQLQEQHKIIMWTDSAIVLGWLQKPPQSLKTFVANRVGDILNEVNVSQWNYVPSDDNPADLGSRGCTPLELQERSLWWHGPKRLQLPQDQWPKPRSFEPNDLETKVATFLSLDNTEDLLSRFSSLGRCLRVIAYIFRFYQKLRKINCKFESFIEPYEIEFAQRRVIQLTQQTFYCREIKALKENFKINSKSTILTLCPFLDENVHYA